VLIRQEAATERSRLINSGKPRFGRSVVPRPLSGGENIPRADAETTDTSNRPNI